MSRAALTLVATPIGNLGDLSPRSIEVLAGSDVIACEDTRRTGRLLAHAGISGKELLVANEHTEFDLIPKILDRLAAGAAVAVVSDAGTPGISDPGARLVRAAIDAGHVVSTVPGPSAAIGALVVSGLTTDRFAFEGFLPRKGAARSERLLELVAEPRTIVLYEAPHRAERTLNDLANVLGPERPVSITRELTKLHEEIWRGTLQDAVTWAAAGLKGELVLVVAGAPQAEPATDTSVVDELRLAIADGASRRDAVASVSERLGVGKNRVYDLANQLDD